MLDSLNINLLIFKEECRSNSAHVSINGKSLGKMYFCQALLLFRTTKLECLNNYIHILITTQAMKTGFPLIIGFSMAKVKEKFVQSYPTLCDLMDYTVHGILQAKILEWVAFPSSRGSSQHRDWTQVSRIAGRRFNLWATSLGRHITLTHVKFLTTKPPVMSQDFLNPDAFFRHYNVKEISK